MKKIDFESELKVLKENKFYRFSDLFFKKGIRWKSDRDTILEKDEYKHTILRKYLEQKTKEYDYDTIKKIIRKYISENDIIYINCLKKNFINSKITKLKKSA